MFSSLRIRNYRLFWIGTVIGNAGDWMDQIALGWLIWQLTGSGTYLGLLAFFRAAPILFFTLLGGALADRIERRRLMQGTQTFAMVLALLLAALVLTDVVQVWHVLAIAALRGVFMSLNMPTRQALISDIVGKDQLMNAIALNSATMNLTKILGGSIGGILITLIGIGGVFLINGLSFIVLIIALAMMTIPPMTQPLHRKSIVGSIGEGLSYIRDNSLMKSLIILALVPMLLGMPYMTLLPVFADTVLDIGNEGYGILVACTGVGAMVGALTIAALSGMRHRGKVMLVVMVLFGVMLLLFSRSSYPLLSFVLLLGVGAGQTTFMALNNTLLQSLSSDEMRGRVMSIFFLNRGMLPLGTLGAGISTELIGVQWTVTIMASALVILGVVMFFRSPEIREIP
jgi:MFS transporter, DHA1 family, staphyloferrin A biosynthesis exporter